MGGAEVEWCTVPLLFRGPGWGLSRPWLQPLAPIMKGQEPPRPAAASWGESSMLPGCGGSARQPYLGLLPNFSLISSILQHGLR